MKRVAAHLTAVCVVVVLLGWVAACGRPTDPAQERVYRAREGKGDLVIAAAWPWDLRKELRYGEGLQLAVDEINARGGLGGRRLRIARYDDRESIDESGRVAQQIVADPDVVAVIGHLQSYTTLQCAPLYDAAGLVHIAPTATDPQLTARGHRRLFRLTFTDRSVGHQLADLAASRSWKRVALGYIRNDYGRNVANAFEARAPQHGIDVRVRSSYDPSEQVSEQTFQQILLEWSAAEIEAIVLAGEVPSAALLVAQARRRGIDVPVLGGDAMSSPGLMAVAGPAAEGAIVASFFHPALPRPEIAAFDAAFRKRYGEPPDAGSALGYDSVSLVAEGIRQAGSAVPEQVAAALHRLTAWPGVTGDFTFDANGDLVDRAVVFSVVREGTFELLPSSPRVGAP